MTPRFRANPDRYDYSQMEETSKDHHSELHYETITADCPLCGEFAELDFHHWAYPPADVVGTHLCRDCHLMIHSPEGARPSETIGNEWVPVALSELVEYWAENYPWLSSDFLSTKFNIPERHHSELKQIVEENQDKVKYVGVVRSE